MKKLAVYSALLVILLGVTACDNRPTSTPQPPSNDRTTTPQNPNQPPPPADRGQIQR